MALGARTLVRLSTQDPEKGQVDFCHCGVLKTIWKGHVGGDVGRRKALSGAEFSVLARLMGPLSGGHRRRALSGMPDILQGPRATRWLDGHG